MADPKKIAVVTSTRADWGLLRPVVDALNEKEGCLPLVIATNMHLDPDRGYTINEIISDGYTPAATVMMPAGDNSAEGTALATSRCLEGMAGAFANLQPDIVLILGDRYEMLAVATAATLMRIPIAHISGGEITEGAFDDNIRHALTKLASLHFATTEQHRRRIIQMGEQPSTVINAGALGVYNFTRLQPLGHNELEAFTGLDLTRPTLLVTYHPATNDTVPAEVRFKGLLKSLDSLSGINILFTYPNNDPGSGKLIEMIEDYVSQRPSAVAIPSLGHRRYLSMLHYVSAVVGNSSSGIVEVPSAGIPTVDIGVRQSGRAAADSVIHCGDSEAEITEALGKALSPQFREKARSTANPYYRPDTPEVIADTLAEIDIKSLLPKHFHDL